MGNPNLIDTLLDCEWGLGTQRSDMGAYGGGDSVIVEVRDESDNIPSGFKLYGNYPNPFNTTTTIEYSLPSAGNVNLEIYNLLGQKVATLVDGWTDAGRHSVNWDASSYSSGIYFYKLTVGDKVFTRRMILLK
jgi:hypothetical protein